MFKTIRELPTILLFLQSGVFEGARHFAASKRAITGPRRKSRGLNNMDMVDDNNSFGPYSTEPKMMKKMKPTAKVPSFFYGSTEPPSEEFIHRRWTPYPSNQAAFSSPPSSNQANFPKSEENPPAVPLKDKAPTISQSLPPSFIPFDFSSAQNLPFKVAQSPPNAGDGSTQLSSVCDKPLPPSAIHDNARRITYRFNIYTSSKDSLSSLKFGQELHWSASAHFLGQCKYGSDDDGANSFETQSLESTFAAKREMPLCNNSRGRGKAFCHIFQGTTLARIFYIQPLGRRHHLFGNFTAATTSITDKVAEDFAAFFDHFCSQLVVTEKNDPSIKGCEFLGFSNEDSVHDNDLLNTAALVGSDNILSTNRRRILATGTVVLVLAFAVLFAIIAILLVRRQRQLCLQRSVLRRAPLNDEDNETFGTGFYDKFFLTSSSCSTGDADASGNRKEEFCVEEVTLPDPGDRQFTPSPLKGTNGAFSTPDFLSPRSTSKQAQEEEDSGTVTLRSNIVKHGDKERYSSPPNPCKLPDQKPHHFFPTRCSVKELQLHTLGIQKMTPPPNKHDAATIAHSDKLVSPEITHTDKFLEQRNSPPSHRKPPSNHLVDRMSLPSPHSFTPKSWPEDEVVLSGLRYVVGEIPRFRDNSALEQMRQKLATKHTTPTIPEDTAEL